MRWIWKHIFLNGWEANMMFNLMRMDFKRLLRQKSLYIILGITAAVVVLAMVTVVIIVNPEFRLQAQEAGMEILNADI